MRRLTLILLFAGLFAATHPAAAQKPYRAGTTSANFLELGYGSAGCAMGDAYVSMPRDISSVYWNPAGLGYMEKNGLQAMYQPWLAGINTSHLAVGFVMPRLGTFALSLYQMAFGDEDVTTMIMQEGTGEKFSGQDLAVSFSYGRRLAQWFSFGTSLKYVNSKIWHESASAVAFDLGAIVNTSFLSWTGKESEGMSIGVIISNYGTRMRYDGMDLKYTVDISPTEQGNFKYLPARFEMQDWELPLLFRIGASFHPLLIGNHRVTMSVDALHPNNNSESLNIGAQYSLTLPQFGLFSARVGHRGLLQADSEYGLTAGFGLQLYYMHNRSLIIDYAWRDIGILGGMHGYTIGFVF